MTEYIQLELFDNEPAKATTLQASSPLAQEQPEQRPLHGATYADWHREMMKRPHPGSPNWTAEMEAERLRHIAEIRQWAKDYCEKHPDKCMPTHP